MKKLIAILLAALMLFTAAFAAAENGKITVAFDSSLSFSLRCPDNYDMESEYLNGYLFMAFMPKNEADVRFTVVICADEEYDGYERLNDLSDEQLQQFAADMVEDYYNPQVEIRETGLGSKIVVANEQDTEMDFVQMQSIYHGYFITSYVRHADGSEVTEDEIQKVLDFHTDMDFVFNSDGQNPVMNLIGSYIDSNSQRATLNIQAVGEGSSAQALLTVHWANSRADGVVWELPCTFDQNAMTFTYENGVKSEYAANELGDVIYVVVSEGLTGTFTVRKDNTITWQDNGEDANNGCVFEYNF